MHDRFGPLPPLVDTLREGDGAAPRAEGSPDHRRPHRAATWSCFEFHPETPVRPETCCSRLPKKEKGRVQLFPDSRLGYRPLERDADGLIGELKALCGRIL